MKKMKAIVFLFLLLSSLSFASGTGEKKGQTVIGFANFFAGVNAYASTYTTIFEELAKKTEGISLISLDARGNPSTQLDQMNTLIAKKVNVIVLWPVDGSAIIPVVKKAFDAGIPVLVTNSPIDKSGYNYVKGFSGPNNVEEGMLAGELMIEGLKGKGKVVELTGTPGYVTSIERHEGFVEAIKKAPGIELLDSQPADWDREKATKVMENYLVKYSKIDGVYAADSGIAIGALNAIKESGRKVGYPDGIIITDATLFGDGWDAIKRGELYGSVYQSPKEDAILAFETARKIVKGEKIQFFNYMVTPKVNIKNVDKFDRPAF